MTISELKKQRDECFKVIVDKALSNQKKGEALSELQDELIRILEEEKESEMVQALREAEEKLIKAGYKGRMFFYRTMPVMKNRGKKFRMKRIRLGRKKRVRPFAIKNKTHLL